jgi:ankyrin repeat protein
VLSPNVSSIFSALNQQCLSLPQTSSAAELTAPVKTLAARRDNTVATSKQYRYVARSGEAGRRRRRKNQMVINDQDKGGNTQLMRAALDGNTAAVKDLLQKGANVNAQNPEGRTALMFAVINLRTDSVKALLKFGADANVQAVCGCTPLMLAACVGDARITQTLLDSGANANKICSPGKTALIVAREHGHHAIVELLKRAMSRTTQVESEKPLSETSRRGFF